MSESSDLRCWRAEASCARRRVRLGDVGDMGEVEQLGQMGEVGVWASLVVGEMEGENVLEFFSLEDVGDPILVFNVSTLCSPSVKLVFQYTVVLGRVPAMGMHPSC